MNLKRDPTFMAISTWRTTQGMTPKIELQYDEKRDSFYIDCGSLDNARHVLNLILYAVEKLNENKQRK